LKDHYWGESPFGNGPDDGCDLRVEKRTVATTKVAAYYKCEWNAAESKSQCQQHGQPSSEFREILLRELLRLGLPANGVPGQRDVRWLGRETGSPASAMFAGWGGKAEKDVHYIVLQSASGWSLLAADYEQVAGTDLTLCEATVAVDPSGQPRVLREVPIKKRLP
jgi:hypothetical protein